MVNDGEEGFDTEDVVSENETLEHIDLGTADFVIAVFFVPGSVFVEPVVSLGLNIEGIAKVGGSRRSHPVHLSVSAQHIVGQLLVLSVVVVLHDTKVSA